MRHIAVFLCVFVALAALWIYSGRERFKSGDPISIRQCTRGYWYQQDYGKYKADRFACTHYHVTLTRKR